MTERATNLVSAIDLATGDRTLIIDQLVRPAAVVTDRDGSLVIADSGANQLVRATVTGDRDIYLVIPIAGSGRTGTRPGFGAEADLAQPCAVVRTPAGLVFCDAASSNIRLLTDAGEVVNVTENELFDFGLVDGLAHRARLERPSGLGSLNDGTLIVADTGNNRLRRVHQRRIETLGLGGLDGPRAVVGYDGTRVVVADTNNHRLLAVDVARHDAWTIAVDGIESSDGDTSIVGERLTTSA